MSTKHFAVSKGEKVSAIHYFFYTYGAARGWPEPTPDDSPVNWVAPVVDPNEPEPAARNNAERVQRTWERSDVREARNTRDGVRVTVKRPDGTVSTTSTHKSTKAAFIEYDLPLNIHVRFRADLKAKRTETLEFEGYDYQFDIIPLSEVEE